MKKLWSNTPEQSTKKINIQNTEYFYDEELLKFVELETVFNEKHTHMREVSWRDNIIDSGVMREGNDDNGFYVQCDNSGANGSSHGMHIFNDTRDLHYIFILM